MTRKNLIFPVFLMAVILLTFISCKEDDEDDPNVIFEATINGAFESPPNTSTATGNATLTYDTIARIFTVVVNYTGANATGAHIHKAAPGVNGDVVFGFDPPITSPINYTSPVLTDDQEADLFGGMYYVNIHSAAYPAGEIRGQLVRK